MKRQMTIWGITVIAGLASVSLEASVTSAPAWPLVSIDPYTSVWMATDTLNAANPVHWTGHEMPMTGILTVDGIPYRFLGMERGKMEVIAPHSEQQSWSCRYSTTDPGIDWQTVGFDDSSWKTGNAPFSTVIKRHDTWVPDAGTEVEGDVWLRREFELNTLPESAKVWLDVTYFDDAEIYVNGKKVAESSSSGSGALHKKILLPASALYKSNIVAAHASHKAGNYGTLDIGVTVEYMPEGSIKVAKQRSVSLTPLSTHYEMECGPMALHVEFLAPLLPDNIELISRPVGYLLYSMESIDGKKHDVSISLDAAQEWACNLGGEEMEAEVVGSDGLVFGKIGTKAQPVLEKWGDDLRIDWGYFYLGGPEKDASVHADKYSVGYSGTLGKIKKGEGYMLLGYDDIYSMIYFGKRLRPYWNRNGDTTILSQLGKAAAELPELRRRCRDFDSKMMTDAEKSGGKEYADLVALAYRQSVHAHKLLQSPEGKLLYLSKENFSNGSVGTVDLTYPSAPLFLMYNPELLKGMMNPVFEYCEGPEWNKPFAAHDVGRYPHANGQNYGGDMPVEESGNMLILCAAIAQREGNPDYAKPHMPVLKQWAEYLQQNGFDPENQLCTDDFAGHLAHNVNLSAKAILGMASFGYLSTLTGDYEAGKLWMTRARTLARRWVALADDGEKFRLAFDCPGTWSLKYNLVWDKVLGFDLFPEKVYEKETQWYLSKLNRYGVPLDSREAYTKSDWLIWVATMASTHEEFLKIISPLHKFISETEDRIPMTDWYWTDRPKAKHYTEHATDKAFRARSVVGGYFMKLYYDTLQAASKNGLNKMK